MAGVPLESRHTQHGQDDAAIKLLRASSPISRDYFPRHKVQLASIRSAFDNNSYQLNLYDSSNDDNPVSICSVFICIFRMCLFHFFYNNYYVPVAMLYTNTKLYSKATCTLSS